jgi:SpoVK/Ycf46/Vps4 family AAA+-type ATPase
VRQSEILDLSHPEDISNVGGMGRLKEWLLARKDCFSEEAQAFGVESPKGAVLVGVPGTGKSLVAKVISSIFGVPLVKLDFGRVFSKFVGDSESRVRAALKMVESMAPVVLFVDEVDKGLGGSGGSADSGVSSRVLGSFLTWLQECKAPVFTVVTANRVDGLPPELLRRGRFDGVFSVGLPNSEERLEVLAIHLRKRERDISKFKKIDLDMFVGASENYVPAEIESAVKDGLIAAFNDPSAKDLEMRHIVAALKDMVPMSKSHKAAIDAMVAWAANNATPVSHPVGEANTAKPTILRRNALRSQQ